MGILSNYCGFGGSGVPQHEVDKLCKIHDEHYGRLQSYYKHLDPYVYWNEADENFLEALAKITPKSHREAIVKEGAQAIFNLKRATVKQFANPLSEPWMLKNIQEDQNDVTETMQGTS